jgi:peroxiredoxin Q/BCP
MAVPAKKRVKKTSAKTTVKSSGTIESKNPAGGRAVEAGNLKVGDKAPAFRLMDDSGKPAALKDFSGRILVLYFYPKDATPGCTQESCDFRDSLNRLASAGASVAGVSADPLESHRKFKAKHGLNFPLLSDPDHSALEAYGVWQEKSLYGRRFMGIVRSTFVIDGKGLIRAVFPKVKVAGHVDEVLAVVRDMKNGAKGMRA